VTARSIALFIAAAIAEIGGAYLIWIAIKDHRGVGFFALGALAPTYVTDPARFPEWQKNVVAGRMEGDGPSAWERGA
jgi:drug/metabolite transporter superfamily protein YnfA